MAGPAIVVVAGFATLWLAASTDDGVIADDMPIDIDGDGSNDYISCPEGYTSGDQGCANNTDCNVFALAKNAGGGTPTCTTMEAGNSNLLDKLFLLPKSDDSVVLCDGSTEIGTVAVASAGAQRADPGHVLGIVCQTAVVHPHRAPVLQARC